MKRMLLALAFVAASMIPASTAERTAFNGTFGTYSADTRRVVMTVEGELARKMFGMLGVQAQDLSCPSYANLPFDTRRRVSDVICTRDGTDYRCYFGFDLAQGRSIGATVC